MSGDQVEGEVAQNSEALGTISGISFTKRDLQFQWNVFSDDR